MNFNRKITGHQIVIAKIKNTKFKKYHKKKIKGFEFNSQYNRVIYGTLGVKFTKETKITEKHIITFRNIILRKQLLNKKKDKFWFRGILQTPVSRKPDEIRMGKGKGPIDHWILKIKPGKIFFELNTHSYIKGLKVLNILLKITGVPGRIIKLKNFNKKFLFF